MFYADRVRETTTTTGTGTITLAGTVAQYQTFTSRVLTGDQLEYVILDANGTAWEVGQGTMASSSTMSRDTVYQSSNSDALITLSSGTHKVFLTYTSQGGNKRLVEGDIHIDFVVSGLALPTTSGTLAGTMTAGVAYVIGQRVVKGAQANTYTASKDTYVDLSNTGVLTYTAVTIGAAAPALTANSIRLGFVTTGGSTITSATTTGLDSLGNVMRNLIYNPTCILTIAYNASITAPTGATVVSFNNASYERVNNDGMHSVGTNPSRVTIQHAGLYEGSGVVQFGNGAGGITSNGTYYSQINLNGTLIEGSQVGTQATIGDFPAIATGWSGYLNVNDYLEFAGYNGAASLSQTIVRANFYVKRCG